MTSDRLPATASRRLLVAAAAGLVVGALVALAAPWQVAVLAGWAAGALTFVVWVWSTILPADGPRSREIATREDDSRILADVILLTACVASLVGVAFVLLKASKSSGLASAGLTAIGVLAVVSAWLTVHTVFTLRYAHVYFRDGEGVDFNDDGDPDYHDFAYLAFTIGMTYQVSDTDLTTKDMRRTALRHALLSFVFGTAIIAMTINIVAGLAS